MLDKLPKWSLNNPLPAFNDMESVTVLEAVHKLYGSMNGLIDDYNKFISDLETSWNKFESDSNKDHELFELEMRQHFQEFIKIVELKLMDAEQLSGRIDSIVSSLVNEKVGNLNERINAQDQKIDEAVASMNTNITETVTEIIDEKFAAGEVTVNAEDVQARNDIETINETLNIHAGDINLLKQDISNLNTSSGSASERFTAIETKNNEQDALLTSIVQKNSEQDTNITNHGNRLASAENTITSQGTRISSAENTLSSHETRLDALGTQVTYTLDGTTLTITTK